MEDGIRASSIPIRTGELEKLRYKWTEDDWLDHRSGEDECRRLSEGLSLVMGLAVAEPFIAPVDLSEYPNYAYIVEYPMDLSTIKVSSCTAFVFWLRKLPEYYFHLLFQILFYYFRNIIFWNIFFYSGSFLNQKKKQKKMNHGSPLFPTILHLCKTFGLVRFNK